MGRDTLIQTTVLFFLIKKKTNNTTRNALTGCCSMECFTSEPTFTFLRQADQTMQIFCQCADLLGKPVSQDEELEMVSFEIEFSFMLQCDIGELILNTSVVRIH